VTYLKNKMPGQWKAHGRYLARESAASGADRTGAAFGRDNENVDIASKLETWQKAGDQRLWKLIVSPEFGERADLTRLTRDLMAHMAKDLGTDLEWMAVEHYNTEHPHVHIALRGLRNDGETLRMSRQYVQHDIRSIAEHLCTRQLGYRTDLDAAEAERREITENRFTSIDRQLIKDAPEISLTDGRQYFAVFRKPGAQSGEAAARRTRHESSRLAVLQRMGLAESTGPGKWLIRGDFEEVLRAMQRTADRQKTLARFGAVISDKRLAIEVFDLSRIMAVEGRVLVHGQDEQSGRNYLMLESTDAKVYFVHYTPEIEEARSRGELRVNSFVRMRNFSVSTAGLLDIQDLGNAQTLLTNRQYFTNAAKNLLKQGIMPTEDGWGGWLGRYQAALVRSANASTQRSREALRRKHEGGRRRERSFGR
jgi:type IV secretory pathway VirD2 relaxase